MAEPFCPSVKYKENHSYPHEKIRKIFSFLFCRKINQIHLPDIILHDSIEKTSTFL